MIAMAEATATPERLGPSMSLGARLSVSDYWNSAVHVHCTIYSTTRQRPHTKIQKHSLDNKDTTKDNTTQGGMNMNIQVLIGHRSIQLPLYYRYYLVSHKIFRKMYGNVFYVL